MNGIDFYLLFSLQQEKRIFTNFHRQLFCWIDRWVELTMEDIRRMEAETQKELEEVRPVSRTVFSHLKSTETGVTVVLFGVLIVHHYIT